MNAAGKIIDRLSGVRETAPGRWMAKCPAHPDKTPSLSICDPGDGKVLLHDFGGCEVGAVLGSLGLSLSDLFDRPLEDSAGKKRASRIPAADILEVISFEVSVAAIILSDVLESHEIGDLGWERFAQAARRINNAKSYCRGRR